MRSRAGADRSGERRVGRSRSAAASSGSGEVRAASKISMPRSAEIGSTPLRAHRLTSSSLSPLVMALAVSQSPHATLVAGRPWWWRWWARASR
ncbi:hypothetical protein ADK49_07035 [Streptomyces sp. WM6349]|nr:hypothetical protein ADK49_07035 [Streptomyces sp. WM6349]